MVRQAMNVLLMCLSLIVFSEHAKALCQFNTSMPFNVTKTLNMPVNATISVTPGMAVGQTVYDQNIILANQGAFYIGCNSTHPYYLGYGLETSLSQTSPGSKIYATSLPGIGVTFGTIAGTFPVSSTLTGCSNVTNCGMTNGYQAYSWILFVKTANTVTPGTINASSLPILIYTMGQNGDMVEIYRIKMTGTITVVVPTCNITPASKAMTINMGKHKLSDFSGSGSHTGWVDASIHLEGCGPFYGYAKTTHATFDGSSTLIPRNAYAKNNFRVTLTPRYGVASGAMKVKQHKTSAVGFGIQLSRSKSDAGVLNLTDVSYNYTDPLPNTGSTTVTVPLFARYVQTAATAISGKADGALEYTVSYN